MPEVATHQEGTFKMALFGESLLEVSSTGSYRKRPMTWAHLRVLPTARTLFPPLPQNWRGSVKRPFEAEKLFAS